MNKPLVIEVWGKQSGRKISRKETGGIKNNAAAQSRKTSVVHETPSGVTNGAIMVRIYRFCKKKRKK